MFYEMLLKTNGFNFQKVSTYEAIMNIVKLRLSARMCFKIV